MITEITPAKYIRVTVFGFQTQREFSAFLDVTQPTISRWENGRFITRHHQSIIRLKAMALKIAWDDSWFFEVPAKVGAVCV